MALLSRGSSEEKRRGEERRQAGRQGRQTGEREPPASQAPVPLLFPWLLALRLDAAQQGAQAGADAREVQQGPSGFL